MRGCAFSIATVLFGACCFTPSYRDADDVSAPVTTTLLAGLAIDREELWVAGARGVLGHYHDGTWEMLDAGVRADLRALWGTSDDLWVVGGDCVPRDEACERSVVLRVRGGVVERLESPLSQPLRAIHGRSPNDVWLVGDLYPASAVLHWNGAALEQREVPMDPTQSIVGVVAIGDDEALLVGGGCVWHARGTALTTRTYPRDHPEDCRAPLHPGATEARGPTAYAAQPTTDGAGAMILGCDPIDGGVSVTWIEGARVTSRGCRGIGLSHPVGAWAAPDTSLYVGLDSGEVIHLDRERCLGTERVRMVPYAITGTDVPWWVGTRGRVLRGRAE